MFDDQPVPVLVVDDNKPWAEYVAQDLERKNPRFSVSVATSANEALQRLRGEAFACVVSDYQMPEISGMQLLTRIREDGLDVPLILLTGQGTEDLASEAIHAGASDYLVKDPQADQTSLIEQRIRTAVRQHRLEQLIKESEERYRTVTEQSRDAIMIVQDGTAVFHNQRLNDLVGYDNADRDEFDPVASLVHPDDREAVRRTFEEWTEGAAVESLREARIVTTEGETRHWEFAGQPITHEGTPAVLVSARDVTERKRRTRELEWEKELNRNVQRALIESQTRAELERTICDQLRAYGYAMAWSGRVVDDEIHPRVVRDGGGAYLDAVALTLDGEHEAEPSVWAARTTEARFVDDFATLFETEWREAALAAGYRSGAALPLVHDDVFYGLLAVYDETPDRFDDTERSLLRSLADTVAYAIHSLDTRQALTSSHAVELELTLKDSAYYLTEVAQLGPAQSEEACIRVDGTVPHDGDRLVQYLEVDGEEAGQFAERAAGHPSVGDVDVVSAPDGRIRIEAAGPTPESRLAELGSIVRETTVDPTGADLRIQVASSTHASDLVESLQETFPSATLESIVEIEREVFPAAGLQTVAERDLTDKQAEALQTAFHHGYFDRPRQSSATDVADALGISHSTFLQHLRAAQQKIFGHLYR